MVFSRSFGEAFKEFTQATDILTREDLVALRDIIKEYLTMNFEMYKVEFLVETNISGERGLEPQWDQDDMYGAYALKKDDQPNGHNALCFLTGQPLWIVAADSSSSTLLSTDSYVDLWSYISVNVSFKRFERENESKSLAGKEQIRTFVALPVRVDGRVCAVFCLESSKKLECTEFAKEELGYIVEGISRLYSIVKHRQSRRSDTNSVIRSLRSSIPKRKLNVFGSDTPKVFFAYSSRADKEVISIIKQEIDEFSNEIELIDWKKISKSGIINEQIIDSIKSSKYGICYFSEISPEEDAKHKYIDNQNVFFEAGMIYILSRSDVFDVNDWLPIREELSTPNIPFDIKGLRILNVPRYKDGSLNDDGLSEELKTRLASLFRDEAKK